MESLTKGNGLAAETGNSVGSYQPQPFLKPKGMTYKEWITTTVTRFGVKAEDVELILANQKALIPDEDAEADPTTAKTALVKEFATVIPLANVSEGGYSVSWNWEAIKMWYNITCGELGIIPANKPKVRNRSNVW